jgi:hypothetical protein
MREDGRRYFRFTNIERKKGEEGSNCVADDDLMSKVLRVYRSIRESAKERPKRFT